MAESMTIDEAIETRSYLADPWFHVCLIECADNREFLAEFDRLYGHNLSMRGTPIEKMVDEATGRTKAGVRAFMEFVARYVWALCPRPEPRDTERERGGNGRAR